MAKTQYSVKTVKTFTREGNTAQEFSNRYYFDGAAPADDAAWTALMDAVTAAEKAIYYADVHVIGAHGYAPTSEVAIQNKVYNLAGTLAGGAPQACPSDCTAVARWATTKRSTKNHVVYCFSYWHAVWNTGLASARDGLDTLQKNAMQTYGNLWLNGLIVGARTYKRTTPDGHAVTGCTVNPFIGHRDFPA